MRSGEDAPRFLDAAPADESCDSSLSVVRSDPDVEELGTLGGRLLDDPLSTATVTGAAVGDGTWDVAISTGAMEGGSGMDLAFQHVLIILKTTKALSL